MAEEKKYQEHYPDGIYEVKVIGQTTGQSEGGKQTPYLLLKVEVLRLKKSKDGRPHNLILGGHRYVKQFLSAGTAPYVAPFLEAAGFKKGSSLKQLDPTDAKHFSLVGFTFDATCKQEKQEMGKNAGKFFDKFEALPIKNNNWMNGLNKPNSAKMLQLDAIFGSQLSGGFSGQNAGLHEIEDLKKNEEQPDSYFPDPIDEDMDLPF